MSELVAKLDGYGLAGWLTLMVVSFVVFWPIGLAVLGYLIWSGRMSFGWSGQRSGWQERVAGKFNAARERFEGEVKGFAGSHSTHNSAFAEYRQAALRRLEDEEREFRTFLNRLRQAKDKAEFDQFMADRRNRPDAAHSSEVTNNDVRL